MGIIGIIAEGGLFVKGGLPITAGLPILIPVFFGAIGCILLWLASNSYTKILSGEKVDKEFLNKLQAGFLLGFLAIIISPVFNFYIFIFTVVYGFPGIVLSIIYWFKWRGSVNA